MIAPCAVGDVRQLRCPLGTQPRRSAIAAARISGRRVQSGLPERGIDRRSAVRLKTEDRWQANCIKKHLAMGRVSTFSFTAAGSVCIGTPDTST